MNTTDQIQFIDVADVKVGDIVTGYRPQGYDNFIPIPKETVLGRTPAFDTDDSIWMMIQVESGTRTSVPYAPGTVLKVWRSKEAESA